MQTLVEYFRCPEHFALLDTVGPLPAEPGFFKFRDAICYGRQAVGAPSPWVEGSLVDVSEGVSSVDGKVLLPFDLSEVVTNLRYERYPRAPQNRLEMLCSSGVAHAVYYFLRPALPVGIRKHLQRLRLREWRRISFPGWPVDVTVESLMKNAVSALLKGRRIRELPFVWFWPDGASGCLMMTHDVEGPAGAEFVPRLMDLDAAFAIRSAFQLVPEASYCDDLLELCRRRGFEVNVHDFNHDGQLFRDRATFDARFAEINRRACHFGSRGFRSGAMYRRQDWFSALQFAFDMSVPNLAHFEPQQGGCCTVLPYFIDNVLELPLTTTQDYALFHYLGDYSIDLWKSQAELILANNGLVSFITHPDYLAKLREREVYVELLRYLVRLRAERNVWVALPSEIDSWWRDRREMRLVREGFSWRVEGPGRDRKSVV